MKKVLFILAATAITLAAQAGSSKSLDLSQFSAWDANAVYDAATTTFTIKSAWAGGQIWYGDGEYALDATGYEELVLELKQAASGTIKIAVDYSNCIVPAQETYIEVGQTVGTITLNGFQIQKISISADRGESDNVIMFKDLRLQSAQEYTEINLWKGEMVAGNWENYIEIEADKLSQMNAGDKIAINVTAIDAQQEWPGVYIYPKGNWDTQIVDQSVKDQTAPLVVEFIFDATQVATAKASGIMVRGCGFTMTSVDLKKASITSFMPIVSTLHDGIHRDLLGRQVDETYKGVVILNGQKIIQ